MADWSKVQLGEVLTPTNREETVDPLKEYRLLGVCLDGQGPFLRETVTGTQIAATKLYQVFNGDFIYSRLFACQGAFGVINEELDGSFVSSGFPSFFAKSERVNVEFLRYWFRLPSVIARVNEDCTGSTPLTRNRFKENFFLALEIKWTLLSRQKIKTFKIVLESRYYRYRSNKRPLAFGNSALDEGVRSCKIQSNS